MLEKQKNGPDTKRHFYKKRRHKNKIENTQDSQNEDTDKTEKVISPEQIWWYNFETNKCGGPINVSRFWSN